MQRWTNTTELRSMDSCIKILCRLQKSKQKLMTLKSSVVIFQALEPLQHQWTQQPQQPQWPQWPQQPHIIKIFIDSDCCIIPGTKMTNICPFLWNGLSKTQFFTSRDARGGGAGGYQLTLFGPRVAYYVHYITMCPPPQLFRPCHGPILSTLFTQCTY